MGGASTASRCLTVNIDCLESIVKSQDPLTGTGPCVFRPDFAAAFFKGVFTDEEAKEAPVVFKKLGLLYLTAKMPLWMLTHQQRAVCAWG